MEIICEPPSSEPMSIDNGNRTLSLAPRIRVRRNTCFGRISCSSECKPPSMLRYKSLSAYRILTVTSPSKLSKAAMTPTLPRASTILMKLTLISQLLHPLPPPLILKLARQTDRQACLGWSSSSPQSDSPRFPLPACSSSSSSRPAVSLIPRLGAFSVPNLSPNAAALLLPLDYDNCTSSCSPRSDGPRSPLLACSSSSSPSSSASIYNRASNMNKNRCSR